MNGESWNKQYLLAWVLDEWMSSELKLDSSPKGSPQSSEMLDPGAPGQGCLQSLCSYALFSLMQL